MNLKTNARTDENRPRGSAQIRVTSRALFQHSREVLIEHAGQTYRLRITQQNKLILNK